MMECDICGRRCTPKQPINCATCARTTLYPLRIEHATTLLDKEALGRHVEAAVKSSDGLAAHSFSLRGSLIDTNECAKRIDVERLRADTAQAEGRIHMIAKQASNLRKEMEEYRKIIAEKRSAIAQRRSDAESATHGLDTRSTNELEAVQKGTKRTQHRWNRLHVETVNARAFLCREAATLAGLKQKRRKHRDGVVRESYYIGGIRVFDLRELNNAPPQQLTASLTNLAFLLVRVSQYLAVRLPAEITLPHKNYPLPTIFQPVSSYIFKDVPYPGPTPTQSSNNSPAASRAFDHRPLPKPRPLWVDVKLPQLAKEDPAAYKYFIEGVTLLAWDTAWLCHTQGMNLAFNSWEDICPLGTNLWQLLVADRESVPMRRVSANPDAAGNTTPATGMPPATAPLFPFGYYSHGTAHSFLGTAEGTDMMRSWKCTTPTKVIDSVKSHLLDQRQSAEWEVLEDKEWDQDHGMPEEEAVLVGTRRRDAEGTSDGRSLFNTMDAIAAPVMEEDGGPQGRVKGMNGWMKLKSRNGEVAK